MSLVNRNGTRRVRTSGGGSSTTGKLAASVASDWYLLLWNGTKRGAEDLKNEVQNWFAAELKLELSTSKTLITHINDGFTFLGFDIRRRKGHHQHMVVHIQPSKKNISKLKTKIRTLTRRNTTHEPVWYKLTQLNQLCKGWSAYYQHVNAKATYQQLDWWSMNRMFRWAWKKHGKPAWHTITAKYKHRDQQGRLNFIYHLEDGSPLWLYRMSDRRIQRYRPPAQRPSYANTTISTGIATTEDVLVKPIRYPAREGDQLRLLAVRRDHYTCQRCGTTTPPFQVHHRQPKQRGGPNTLNNLTTRCPSCHHEEHREIGQAGLS